MPSYHAISSLVVARHYCPSACTSCRLCHWRQATIAELVAVFHPFRCMSLLFFQTVLTQDDRLCDGVNVLFLTTPTCSADLFPFQNKKKVEGEAVILEKLLRGSFSLPPLKTKKEKKRKKKKEERKCSMC